MDLADGSALLIIDVQRDFCTDGALAVPGAETILPRLNQLLAQAATFPVPVYASRDWHPPASTHFAEQGGRWPVHCTAGTRGAEFHPGLHLPRDTIVISKGQSPTEDGYSAFDGTTASGQTLRQDLASRQVGHLAVAGLATDYCVRCSVLDALQAGFQVTVVSDAIAGVDLSPNDSDRAIDEMTSTGARFMRAVDLLQPETTSWPGGRR